MGCGGAVVVVGGAVVVGVGVVAGPPAVAVLSSFIDRETTAAPTPRPSSPARRSDHRGTESLHQGDFTTSGGEYPGGGWYWDIAPER
jgi:hypothetical protein